MRVLVTGARGFVGKAICAELIDRGFDVVAVARVHDALLSEISSKFIVTSASEMADEIKSDLQDVDVVIHLAAHVHILGRADDAKSDDLYHQVNTMQTIRLFEQSQLAGVKRFIFMSSVKVNGEDSQSGVYDELSPPQPVDLYGKSKWDAEKALHESYKLGTTDYVIVRSPLVYGPEVKANFHSLLGLCQRLLPLPFGAIHNRRSLIYIGNLVDFVIACATQANAANQTFLISDDEDVSTTQLIASIRKYFHKPALLIPIPEKLLVWVLCCLGKQTVAARLCGNLRVSISKAKTILNWRPPFTFEQGIQNTVVAFRHNNEKNS
jgi:nucleoside-diphosphate-sugar epimerase